MNDMIGLFAAMYKDVYGLSGAHTNVKDIEYLTRRVDAEGISFLTITLPTFADALLMGLSEGRWPHSMVSGFARNHGKSLPKFLSGLTRRIFDIESGVLLSDPCINSISGVRQLCSSFKKIELTCTTERIENGYQKYLDTDSEVVSCRSIKEVDRQNLRRVFTALFGRAISEVEREVYYGQLFPRYSSGAVAERFNENQKFSAPYYERLETIIPPDWFMVPNLGANNELSGREFVPIGRELPARITHVPKTLKTPRLIAIEPTCIQFAQQALMESIYRNVGRTAVGRKSVNFRDQTINAQKALKGSIDGSIATLDLSEASDRVSAGLVSYLFRNFPHTREALFRARSSRVSLPNGAVRRLRKFASMGSATCFPIEAMVFMAIVTYGIMLVDRQDWSPAAIRRAGSQATVFGDDITVPVGYAPYVVMALEFFGLKVNRNKSFAKGLFRESCGTDAYAGVIITPTYVRHRFPRTTEDTGEVVSAVSLCNQLFAGGLWGASEYVRKKVERACKVRLPVVLDTSPGLGLNIPWRSNYDQKRYNDELQRPEVRTYIVQSCTERTELTGVESSAKSLLLLESRVQGDHRSKRCYHSGLHPKRSEGHWVDILGAGDPDQPIDGILTFSGSPQEGDRSLHSSRSFSDLVDARLLCSDHMSYNLDNRLRYLAHLSRGNRGRSDLAVVTKRHVFRLKRAWTTPY